MAQSNVVFVLLLTFFKLLYHFSAFRFFDLLDYLLLESDKLANDLDV